MNEPRVDLSAIVGGIFVVVLILAIAFLGNALLVAAVVR